MPEKSQIDWTQYDINAGETTTFISKFNNYLAARVTDENDRKWTYSAYATSDTGTGFSLVPFAGCTHVAVKSFNNPLSTIVVGDFVGAWFPLSRGIQGFPGAAGDMKYLDNCPRGDGYVTDVNRSDTIPATSNKYIGCAVAANGAIYACPHTATSVLKYNPVTNELNEIGSLAGSAKWYGIARHSNGKLYCAPHSSTSVLEIDPSTDTVRTFGSIAGATKYTGIISHPNGKLYCIPYTATNVLEIDPVTDTLRTFGTIPAVASAYIGGCLHPNGKIYCTPYNSATVLEIDPSTGTLTQFGSLSGAAKWRGMAYDPYSGNLFCAPFSSASVLMIDPVGQTATTFGAVSGVTKYGGIVQLSPTELVCVPYSATNWLRIYTTLAPDPSAAAIPYPGSVIAGNKYLACCHHPSGNIYAMPYLTQTIGQHGGKFEAVPAWYYTGQFGGF